MTTASNASNNVAASQEPAPAEALTSIPEGAKPKISPAERWLKIREKACLRAQKRGFVGGNPFTDWSEAEKEIDAKYDTDPNGASLSAPEQIRSQINCILTRYGLDDLGVDAFLEQHQQAMEKLTAFDHTLIGGTAELASRQTALAQDALHEVATTLQSVAQGKLSMDALTTQTELSMKAMENALSHFRAVAEAITGMAQGGKKDNSSES